MDIRQSSNYAEFMKSLGWLVEKAGEANVFIRHFPLFSRWSVIKVQRPIRLDLVELDRMAKEHRALFVKLEPDKDLPFIDDSLQQGFIKDNWPLLPTKSIVLNLLITNLERLPKDTRYEIRLAERNGVRVELSENITLFYKLLSETMKIGHWSVPIEKEVTNLWKSCQPKNSQIFLAYSSGPSIGSLQGLALQRLLGGALLIWDSEAAHYMYAALNHKGRSLGAAYTLLWEAVKFCQHKKLKFLDLEGIYDERYASHTKNWQGFTKFKMGWGGEVKDYDGSYTKYFNRLARLLFERFN